MYRTRREVDQAACTHKWYSEADFNKGVESSFLLIESPTRVEFDICLECGKFAQLIRNHEEKPNERNY